MIIKNRTKGYLFLLVAIFPNCKELVTEPQLAGSNWKLAFYEENVNRSVTYINKNETYSIKFIDNQTIIGYNNCNTFKCHCFLYHNDSISISILAIDRLSCPNRLSNFNMIPPLINAIYCHCNQSGLELFYKDTKSGSEGILHFIRTS